MTDLPGNPDGYVELELLYDVTSMEETGMEYMQFAVDNWRRKAGNPDTIMIESAAQMLGELGEQASMMPPEAMIYLGTTIYGIPVEAGLPATGVATLTFEADVPSYVVPAGAEVSVPSNVGPSVIFETVEQVSAPVGGGVVTVDIVAQDVGVGGNGAFGVAELVEPFEGLTLEVIGATDLGVDAETAQEYLNRLTTLLPIQAPRPILPQDHATIAAINALVGRVTAIDLLCPGTTAEPDAIRDPNEVLYFAGKTPPESPPTANLVDEPRCTTVAITALDGTAPTEGLMQEVWDALDASREVNFLNYVIPPTYTSIDVRGNVKAYPGQGTDEEAADAAEAQIAEWLDPLTFGQIPGNATSKTWANDDRIRHDEAVDYANRGAGVWYTSNVQMKKSSDATWLDGDVLLTGVAPLPLAGTITFTPEPVE